MAERRARGIALVLPAADGGRADAHAAALDRPARPAPFRPGRARQAAANVEAVSVEPPATRTTVVGAQATQAGEQTIRPDAKLLFVAGAGWTKKQADGVPHAGEAEQLILDFLRASQASLGGSKSLVDLSGEGEAVLRVHDAHESDRPDGVDAAASERSFDMLSWRGAARGRLAFHQRAAGDQSGRELRVGARQGGCAVRR